MRTPIIAGNWKCNLRLDTAFELASGLKERIDGIEGVEKIVCPSFIHIPSIEVALTMTSIRVGAQDLHWEDDVAATGEVGPKQLEELVDLVIIGHSERRHKFGETDEMVNKKVAAALETGLQPIMCVGETLEERQSGRTDQVLVRQTTHGLRDVDMPEGFIIAYEPVWAIGTGRNTTPADAAAVHREIRTWLAGRGARQATVLYGGSVNLQNAAALLAERELDGVLVGGASLDPAGWARLVRTPAA